MFGAGTERHRWKENVVMINEWYDFHVCTPVRRYLKDTR